MISNTEKKNFETISEAFANDDVALMECTYTATGDRVAVLCATFVDEDGEINFLPFAKFFSKNPYEELTPPGDD